MRWSLRQIVAGGLLALALALGIAQSARLVAQATTTEQIIADPGGSGGGGTG